MSTCEYSVRVDDCSVRTSGTDSCNRCTKHYFRATTADRVRMQTRNSPGSSPILCIISSYIRSTPYSVQHVFYVLYTRTRMYLFMSVCMQLRASYVRLVRAERESCRCFRAFVTLPVTGQQLPARVCRVDNNILYSKDYTYSYYTISKSAAV